MTLSNYNLETLKYDKLVTFLNSIDSREIIVQNIFYSNRYLIT